MKHVKEVRGCQEWNVLSQFMGAFPRKHDLRRHVEAVHKMIKNKNKRQCLKDTLIKVFIHQSFMK